jgi:ADP-ribose pyrophosphatase YjhB (NUDIX family)
MLEKEIKLLAGLLLKMLKECGDFIPEGVWLIIHKIFALPYLELAIVRQVNGEVEILLTHRVDKYWSGWHIPGGLWRTHQTLEAGIASIAKNELGIEVELLAIGVWEKWMNHPYGYPISHVVICSPKTEIIETGKLGWFHTVPSGMIEDGGHHVTFIESVFQQVRNQNLLPC